MAHLIDGKGPYPDKAGEYCGNHHSDFEMDILPEERKRQKEYLSQMRFGKPSNCVAGTSEEMAAKGWVGLYLKKDCKVFDWETPIETDELTEDVVSSPSRPARNSLRLVFDPAPPGTQKKAAEMIVDIIAHVKADSTVADFLQSSKRESPGQNGEVS